MPLAAPYRPYVNSPGANPAAAARFTNAAAQFYPAVYGGGTASPGAGGAATAPAVPLDYQKLLAGDPLLGQALAGYNAQGVQNQAQLSAAQMRALIQRGLVPSMNLPGSPNIDATTRALAEQNTQAGTSTQAGLRRAYETAQQGSTADLAARGILRSGAYGQHAAENLQGYNQAGYQADQQLLDYLQGLYSGYLQQQQTLQGSGVTATNDALTRIIQQINAGQLAGGAPAGYVSNDQYQVVGPVPGAAGYASGGQPDPFAGISPEVWQRYGRRAV